MAEEQVAGCYEILSTHSRYEKVNRATLGGLPGPDDARPRWEGRSAGVDKNNGKQGSHHPDLELASPTGFAPASARKPGCSERRAGRKSHCAELRLKRSSKVSLSPFALGPKVLW